MFLSMLTRGRLLHLDGGVGTDAVHAAGVGDGIQVVVAGLAHGGDDDGVVLVLGQGVGDEGHHGVVDGHTGQNAVGTVDILGQNVIGDDHAVAAPLVAQDAGDQTVVAAGPDSAPAGVGNHNAVAVADLDGSLEGFQVDFTGSLLVQPDAQTDTVLLAVVQGKVLHNNVDALVPE